MKKIYTLAAAATLIAATAVGQQPLKKDLQPKLKNDYNKETSTLLEGSTFSGKIAKEQNLKAGNGLSIIYETDVDPADWTLTVDPSYSQVITWVVDTLDQVDPNATTGISTIETRFGSDAWDDEAHGNALVCESYNAVRGGEYLAGILTQATLNAPITVVPGQPYKLLFSQIYRATNFDECSILVKENAGDPWTVLPIKPNANILGGGSSGNKAPLLIEDLSTFTATMTSTTLYIGFEYKCDYYPAYPASGFYGSNGWAIDDIKLIEPIQSNFTVGTIYQGDILNDDSFKDKVYGGIPLHALGDSVAFTVVVDNAGELTQNVDILVELVNSDGAVESSNTVSYVMSEDSTTFDPSTNLGARSPGVWTVVKLKTPKEWKKYTVRATATPDTEDEIPSDNVKTNSFEITQNRYIPFDDNNNSIGSYGFDAPDAANSQGVLFKYPTAGTTITDMQFYISDDGDLPTDVAQFIVNIYYVPATADLSDGVSTVTADNEAINLTPGGIELFVDASEYNAYKVVNLVEQIGNPITVAANQTDGFFLLSYTSPQGQTYGAYATNNNLDGKGLWIGLNGTGTNFISAYSNTTPIIIARSSLPNSIAANAVAKNFSLGQNVPNPFAGTSAISYNLVNNANVSLTVFDLTGKAVFTTGTNLVNAGEHTVTIDASNFNAGLYYYTLNVDGQALTKKMIVTK